MVDKEYFQSCLVCNSDNSSIVETTSTMMGNQQEKWSFRKCNNCNLVFLSPRVSKENLADFYTESYLPYRGSKAWGKYADLVESDQNKIDLRRVDTVKKYALDQSKMILDIGCGKPSFLLHAHRRMGMKAVGLDFSDEGWKEDKNQYKSLELYKGEIEDLPSTVKANVITMWHYLEHDYNPRKTLQTLSNQNLKDTLLIIEVPNYDSYTRKKYGQFWSGYHSPRHSVLYTPDTIKKLLFSCGWNVDDLFTYGSLDPYTLDWMSRMEREGIDWTGSMEPRFVNYVLGKIIRPRFYFQKSNSLGFMTVVARNKG